MGVGLKPTLWAPSSLIAADTRFSTQPAQPAYLTYSKLTSVSIVNLSMLPLSKLFTCGCETPSNFDWLGILVITTSLVYTTANLNNIWIICSLLNHKKKLSASKLSWQQVAISPIQPPTTSVKARYYFHTCPHTRAQFSPKILIMASSE